jgi:release factor glutamine methyltransferase
MTILSRDMTLAQARRTLADAFRQVGLDAPELDARLLVSQATGLDHTALTINGDRLLDDSSAALEALAARRLSREPVARILGSKEFWGLPFALNRATLVPRPETETVVEAALTAIDAIGPRSRALRIADLGTGSGALLLALLHELPNATGVGTDVSEEALAAARDNAAQLGLDRRAQFVLSDFGAALVGRYDVVVSNPPYIASSDIETLPPEVRHDPRAALDGGPDGLAAYRTIAAQATRWLAQDGILVVELGMGQEPAVAALFRAAGLSPSPAIADLSGIPRALPARVATMTP